ncbi:MAG: hypothetical protein Q7T19_09840 [Caulobacter sp.]|nr:hypothetical protein [Caulobacter sp.]
MPVIIEPPPEEDAPRPSLRRRIGWFIGLAVASMAATVLVAYTLKALLV